MLTSSALGDLDRISAEGAIQYGYVQSEFYERKLVDMLDTLAGSPYLAAERQASSMSVRLMPCGAHHMLYVIENEDIVILRVLHGLQNWFDLL